MDGFGRSRARPGAEHRPMHRVADAATTDARAAYAAASAVAYTPRSSSAIRTGCPVSSDRFPAMPTDTAFTPSA